ncbi:MAG: anti-sigma factor [Pseudomonadota bacterium]
MTRPPEDMMPENGDNDDALISEYVLRLADPEVHKVMEAREATDPAFAAKVAETRARFSAMDDAFAPIDPPTAVKKAIDARLFGEAVPAKSSGLWGSLAFWRLSTLIGAAAAATLAVFVALAPDAQSPTAPFAVATIQTAETDGIFTVLYQADAGALSVVSQSAQMLSANDYELWAIQGDNPPLSLGLLARNGQGQLTLGDDERLLLAAGATVLAISLEPEGGSPTGAPTGPVLGAGDLKIIEPANS